MKALILTLATLLPLAPQPMHASDGTHGRALQLTADQKTKIQALRAGQREAMAPKRRTAQEARAAFAKAMRDPATPEATLRDLHQRASEAHFQMLLAGRASQAQVRALLTPEQREKASAISATHRERARNRMRMMRMMRRD